MTLKFPKIPEYRTVYLVVLGFAVSACVLPFDTDDSSPPNVPSPTSSTSTDTPNETVPEHGATWPRPPDDGVLAEPVVNWGLSGETTETLVTPEHGGELTLSDDLGLSYRLVVPAGAVGSDTVVVMTLLEDVSISGAGNLCNLDEADRATCFQGVLIEPNGLSLFQSASLSMDVPDGAAPAPELGFVAFGASDLPYELNPTTDTANGIETSVSTLSGFATAAPDSLALEALSFPYLRAVLAAVEHPREFAEPLEQLVGLANYLALAGHAELATEASLLASWGLEVTCDILDALDPLEWDEAALTALVDMLGTLEANRAVFADFPPDDEEEMLENMWKISHLWADEGIAMCEQGACSGQERLGSVLGLFEQGLLNDEELAGQLETVHGACCLPLAVTIETEDSRIARAVLPEQDHSLAYTTASVRVTRGGVLPIDGAQVEVLWDRDLSILQEGVTDEGDFAFPVTAERINDSDFGCDDQLVVELTALVTLPNETASSAFTELVIDNLSFETTVSYHTDIVVGSPGVNGYLHLISEFDGSVTTSGLEGCPGLEGEQVDRRYDCELFEDGKVGTMDILRGAPLSMTLSRGKYVLEALEGGVSVPVLRSIDVHRPCDLLDPVTFRYCEEDDCFQFDHAIPIQPHALLYPLPWPAGLCEAGLSLSVSGDQSDRFDWTDGETGTTFSLDVTVNPAQ